MANLFKTPATPQVAAAAPQPDANSSAVLEAQKQAMLAAAGRDGRASTITGKQGTNGQSRAPVATAADTYASRSLGSGQ